MGDSVLDQHIEITPGIAGGTPRIASVPEAGMMGATDDAHLAYALAQRRVLFTQDADFMRLAATGVAHAGIIYAPQFTTIGNIIRGLVLIAQIVESEEMLGKIEYL